MKTRRRNAPPASDGFVSWDDLFATPSAWGGALLIVLLMVCLGPFLDGLPSRRHEFAQAQEIEAQHLRADAERAYIQQAQATCGPNTWWRSLADGTRVCTTKRGQPTGQLLAGANP